MQRVDPTLSEQTTAGPSFEMVFREEFPQVVRLAYVLTGSNATAQDVAQEAFARLFERYLSVTNPAGFVRTAAVNAIRDRGRRQRIRRRFHETMTAPPVDDHHWDPEYLLDALATLSEQRRAMVVLRFYEQRTVPEIAQILGVAEGTVKSGLARSLSHLRDVLT